MWNSSPLKVLRHSESLVLGQECTDFKGPYRDSDGQPGLGTLPKCIFNSIKKKKCPHYFCLASEAPRRKKPNSTSLHIIASAATLQKWPFQLAQTLVNVRRSQSCTRKTTGRGPWPWASFKIPVPPTQGPTTLLNQTWNKRHGVKRKQNSFTSSLDFYSFVCLCAMEYKDSP